MPILYFYFAIKERYPRYLRGKEEILQLTRTASILASSIVMFIGIISVLLKLILIPDKASKAYNAHKTVSTHCKSALVGD
jgi:hypothetical protein